MYQLGEYNRRKDLTEQGTEIRDLVLTNPDYDTLKSKIEEINILEEESIIILKRAILAGYSTSYYGFGWAKEMEIEFWELVNSKAPNSGVSILTLADSYRAHNAKTLKEVAQMYMSAIEINSEHYYLIMSEDFDLFRKDDELKFKFTDIELEVLEEQWGIEEFKEELPYIKQQCDGDEELVQYKTQKIAEIIKRKAANIKPTSG